MKVKKTFGEIPTIVVVGATPVEFDDGGEASVTPEIAAQLEKVPGYKVIKEEVKVPEAEKAHKVATIQKAKPKK